MLKVIYSHPLHGTQELICHTLTNSEEGTHAKNIHGATFQLLRPERIMSVTFIEENRKDETHATTTI